MHVTTRYDTTPPPARNDRWVWRLLLSLAVVSALAVAVVVTWAVVRDDGGSPAPGGSVVPSATASPSGGTTAGPTASTTPTGGSSATPSPSSGGLPAFAYQPLWPFGSTAQAAAWQRQYRASGSQPWHLDAGLTALAFSGEHLGFTALTEETSRREVGREAWVGVGHERPDGRSATAAVVHLARMGAGTDAPWEVAGTRDSTLSITVPPYGAAVRSPLTVGGRITGVDESLRVAVVDPSGRRLGQVAGIPAGGTGSPWSVRVAFAPPTGTVVTVVVSTGGHLAEVERFAVTAVRVAGT